jgi:two-component system, NtrC family, response regulator AtoC
MGTSVNTANLLVVSRDLGVLRLISSVGTANNWQLQTASNGWEAMERVQSGPAPDLLLLDLPAGDGDGLDVLRWLRRLRPVLRVILIGHQGDDHKRDESIRMGACEYLTRPIEDCQLQAIIESSLSAGSESPEVDITSDDVEALDADTYFVAISPVMRKLRAQAALLAEANVPVLILGERGSGKETIARLIHKLSVRSGFPIAKVNCSALPEDLLLRELFGHESVGAVGPGWKRPGKMELCAKGTLFLDDITEMPPALQSAIVQVIKNKRFIRPGTSTSIEADVRILAACPTGETIAERKLRDDFYNILSAYTIQVPPLRDRNEELPFLSRHFMHHLAKRYGLSPREFSPAILQAWQAYPWPGNLQELEHCVKRYLMVGDIELAFENGRAHPDRKASSVLGARPQLIGQLSPSPSQLSTDASGTRSLRSLLKSVKSEAERNAIANALERTGGNRKAAARLLNVSYRTVLYKIEQYKMIPPAPAQLPRVDGPRNGEAGIRKNVRTGFAGPDAKPLQDRRRELL